MISINAGGSVSAGRDIVINEGATSSAPDKAADEAQDVLKKVDMIVAKLHEQNQTQIAEQIKNNLPQKGTPATEHLCNLITAAGVLIADLNPLVSAVLRVFKKSPEGEGKP